MSKFKCPACGNSFSGSTAFGNHIRMKAKNGSDSHKEIYRKASDSSSSDDQDGDKNLVEEWKEDVEQEEDEESDDQDGMQVKEIGTNDQGDEDQDDESDWKLISNFTRDDLKKFSRKQDASLQEAAAFLKEASEKGESKVNLETGVTV